MLITPGGQTVCLGAAWYHRQGAKTIIIITEIQRVVAWLWPLVTP